jgi:hypothetical protein
MFLDLREDKMNKGNILKQKKFLKIIKIAIITVIFIALISNTTISVNITKEKTNELKNIENEKLDKTISDGLAPRNNNYSNLPDIRTNDFHKKLIDDCTTMYGYNAYPGPESTIFFDTCEPQTIEELGETISEDFLAGGTFGCDGIWYATEYGNGILYGIDPYSGDMWSIGGGGVGINGLAYNPTNNKMYGCSSDDYLYEIDPDTGEQEMMGNLGYSGGLMIGMAFDSEGVLYGWDLIQDSLWIIPDPEEPSAELVGSLGLALNYAQDGDFDRETDTLYLTAYTDTGKLYQCDKDTGKCTLIGEFEDGMEVTASIFLNCCGLLDHDVSLRSIDYPETGRAEPDMPMQITVKNTGNNTETFDAQMEINYDSPGKILMDENFSGDFPPDGWETECWEQCWYENDGYACFNVSCESEDYSITTKPVNASEYEQCNIRFMWGGNYYYPQYARIHVMIRRNETSPWKDVTPWDNPVGENQDGELWEIGIYGFGEPLGEGLQIKWVPVGYLYYFQYLYLDDVVIEAVENVTGYAELFEDITLEKGEEKLIEFPDWTPSDWQNESVENTWKEYIVHAFIILEGDQNPRNDEKWKAIDLWFPWMYDIEVMSIDSPHSEGESLPGQTFPVQATIRNVGQYEVCCIPIDIRIGKPQFNKTLLNENNWNTVPPEGWHDQHKDYDPDYGWRKSNTSYSKGSSPEAYISYDYCKRGLIFYSYAIEISEYNLLTLRFKSYIDHWLGQGYYALEAGYSIDGETWNAVWHEEPSSNKQYDVDIPISGGFNTTYIGFWVKGDPNYFNNWYIDDVELIAIDLEEEYYDHACQGPDLEPGEEATFYFEDWTPEFLLEEETGTEEYYIEAEIECEVDKNSGNDIKSEFLTLDFWHDVGIFEITSPSREYQDIMGEYILWDNGEPDGRNGLPGSMYQGYSNILIDDFENEEYWYIQGGHIHILWNSGSSANLDTLKVYVFEETGDCDPSMDEYATAEISDFTEETTGEYYYGRPEVIVDFLLAEEINIEPGKWWIAMQPDSIGEDLAYILTAESKGCMCYADLPYWGYPRWTSTQYLYGEEYDLAWQLDGGPWRPLPVYIQPGLQDINAIVMNYGTFPKYDLSCYAEIKEFITDPYHGTQVYTDEINNIDLPIPLGGDEELEFEDFTFADEGRYQLFVNLPASPDDENKNNNDSIRIYVDDTEPESDYPPILDPPDPTGCNGWYVSDVTVTLNSTDPWSNSVSSGVKEIRYTINGGAELVIPGKTGSFALTEDGEDILIEYWAVDCVGNEESPKNFFTIDIDLTKPNVNLSYEVISGNKWQGWDFLFIAYPEDAMSGIDYVEFYFNYELQDIVDAPGPYEWLYTYYGGLDVVVTAIAYDKAGNFDSDEIINPSTSQNSFSKSKNIRSSTFRIKQPLTR